MNPERWQKLNELFHSALECETEKREAFVAEACQGDDDLRRELKSMIDHHEQADSFIESPAYAIHAETLVADDEGTLVGQSLGPYRVLAVLGAGGMGEVYLAFDTMLHRKVALKFLHSHLTGDSRRAQRFRQEARAASALNHPNILTVFEIGEIDGRQFIATEFVDGQTLRQLIKSAPLKLSNVLHVAIQIGSALSAAHAAGIVHRDIKPENLMLRADGYIKLVDFGVAKLSEKTNLDSNASTLIQTETGSTIGTIRYMSPEQVRVLDVDGRTDIWSFGLVLCEMTTGRFPFKGETVGDLVVDILGSDPEPLSRHDTNVPVELERIVNKSLIKERDKRYQTVDEMLHDLIQLRARIQTGKKFDTVRGNRNKRLALGVAAAVVFVLLAVLVAKFWLPAGHKREEINDGTVAPATTMERVLSYSLTVQKVSGDRPAAAPFESYGQEIFENGWKFRLNLSSPQSGFLYLLNEAPASGAPRNFRLLYPDSAEGSGPSQIPGNQTIRTGWYVFDRNPGTEKLWIVWSAKPTPELESARRFFNAKDKGLITAPADSQAVEQFLASHSVARPKVEKDVERTQIKLSARGEVLVNELELQHR
jgi:serine/threonine protein kinase